MTDTPTPELTAEELADLCQRHRAHPLLHCPDRCAYDGQRYPCDAARLLDHAAALAADRDMDRKNLDACSERYRDLQQRSKQWLEAAEAARAGLAAAAAAAERALAMVRTEFVKWWPGCLECECAEEEDGDLCMLCAGERAIAAADQSLASRATGGADGR